MYSNKDFLKFKMQFTVVAAFLDVKPGMRVVDTCAGGGKTAYGTLMENKDY
jgi:16S rRNA C967 or C1407 C5-methylase (RsmB/RsmF family)